MTRKDFLSITGLSGLAASIPFAPKIAQALNPAASADDLSVAKNPQHRRFIAIADADLISSRLLPLRAKSQGRIERIAAGSRCYICVSDEPRVYLLAEGAEGHVHSPDVLWPYRCGYGYPDWPHFTVWEWTHANFVVYTTSALFIARAKWWESQNNHAAAQADRNFAKLIERI